MNNGANVLSVKRCSGERIILVTGAGGFIGGWCAEMLRLEGPWRVRAGVRRWSSAARIARFSIEMSLCDVMDRISLDKVMDGVTDVVHCATGDSRTIVDGTRNVLTAAHERGARVIHLSSIAVYGSATGLVNEDTPFESNSAYSHAKIETEQLCREYNKRGLRTVVLRPTIVYGPYSTLWTTNIASRLLTGQWGNLGTAGNGACNLVYVLDVTHAIQRALISDCVDGQAFNVNGPEHITWNEYFRLFNEMLGLPPLKNSNPGVARWKSRFLQPVRSFGKFMLKNHREFLIAAANRSQRLKTMLKSTEATMRATATSDQLDLYCLNAQYSSENAMRLIGYRPSYSIENGLNLACAWLKHSGIG
jgi:nucleoside-diphosphate-sugar epimerase